MFVILSELHIFFIINISFQNLVPHLINVCMYLKNYKSNYQKIFFFTWMSQKKHLFVIRKPIVLKSVILRFSFKSNQSIKTHQLPIIGVNFQIKKHEFDDQRSTFFFLQKHLHTPIQNKSLVLDRPLSDFDNWPNSHQLKRNKSSLVTVVVQLGAVE